MHAVPQSDTFGEKKRSPFSATEIGQGAKSVQNDRNKQHFREEAAQVTDFLRGVHHARKLGHMQVNYSDTVGKLSKIQATVPVLLQEPKQPDPPHSISKNHETVIVKRKEFEESMNRNIGNESSLNQLKRMNNREIGRKAVVNEVMNGTGAIPKNLLFPQKATHMQILAMTGSLCMPDANTVPARITRGVKWLGEGVGWEVRPGVAPTPLPGGIGDRNN